MSACYFVISRNWSLDTPDRPSAVYALINPITRRIFKISNFSQKLTITQSIFLVFGISRLIFFFRSEPYFEKNEIFVLLKFRLNRANFSKRWHCFSTDFILIKETIRLKLMIITKKFCSRFGDILFYKIDFTVFGLHRDHPKAW